MKVAIIGAGVAGLVAADALRAHVELTVFEAAPHLGGDAYSIALADGAGGTSHPVDTGFVVYTDRTYPEFARLVARLGVETQTTTMSFSVRDDAAGVAFSTHAMRAMPLRDFFKADPYRILWDALRFRRHARRYVHDTTLTVGEYLALGGYSRAFQEYLLLPPCAAVWCADFDSIRAFPFARWYPFLERHGFANVLDPPTWRVIAGGASRYVERLAAPFAHAVRLATPIARVERTAGGGVSVVPREGAPQHFDQVVLATHADQALALVAQPSAAERRVLGAFRYSTNDVVVHHDPAVLPRDRRMWSSWNYHLERPQRPLVTVTYLMNVLHRFASERPYCLSLNRSEAIDPALVVRRFNASHPRFDRAAFAAQAELAALSGADRIHYCGAYFGYGFHEDAVVSAQAAARAVLARA